MMCIRAIKLDYVEKIARRERRADFLGEWTHLFILSPDRFAYENVIVSRYCKSKRLFRQLLNELIR